MSDKCAYLVKYLTTSVNEEFCAKFDEKCKCLAFINPKKSGVCHSFTPAVVGGVLKEFRPHQLVGRVFKVKSNKVEEIHLCTSYVAEPRIFVIGNKGFTLELVYEALEILDGAEWKAVKEVTGGFKDERDKVY
jgi:hypothetical protein